MLQERVNPNYIKELREDNSLGTPLFDAIREKPVPPETIVPSAAKIESFKKMLKDGGMKRSALRIYTLIKKHGPITVRQLEERFGVRPSDGSGRTSDLVDAGYVEAVGRIINPNTNRPNTLYKAVDGKNFNG